jgi:hypothetical protein
MECAAELTYSQESAANFFRDSLIASICNLCIPVT